MPRRWPYCPPRRGRTTFSYMYLLLYQLNIQTPHTAAPAFTRLRRQYKYPGSLNTPPSAQIDDFPPLTSRSSVSGPCTRVVSHYPIKIRSGRPDRISIGQCDTTLVQGPETDERDLSGGKSSICTGGGVFIIPAYLYWRRSDVKAGAAVCRV